MVAIEVKAEENLRAKSLRVFKEKHPDAVALRFSMSGYREQNWMRNVPLYAMANRKLWGTSDAVGANALSAKACRAQSNAEGVVPCHLWEVPVDRRGELENRSHKAE